ncbi:GNAT family N-acetyltransferase [Chloroflexota bacterium]
MKESWIWRDYQIGDEHQILNLYKEVNQKEMTLAHWTWKFAENPFGKAIIKLLFDGNKLIGHYAVLPMDVQVQGKPVKAALSVNTMTHPDYRGHGIFPFLGQETYQTCMDNGIRFIYGFPNNNIYQPRINKLEWIGFGKMTSLEKELEPGNMGAIEPESQICPIDSFDERVNSLWNKTRSGYSISVIRTTEFLNWRFTAHPVVNYPKYVYADDNNNVLGYMALKTFIDEDEIKGHIVDMLCIDEEYIFRHLISYACNYFIENGITNLSCWAPEGSFYSRVLEKEDFFRTEFNVYFGIRTLDMEDESISDIKQMTNWHLTMGDIDVF